MFAAALCLAVPLAGAAELSWDPLKDVEGVPHESKVIQARHQVREMAQDALASLYEILLGAQANADGQGGMFAGAAAIVPGVYLYQLTDTGISATLTVSGTIFFKDGDLY